MVQRRGHDEPFVDLGIPVGELITDDALRPVARDGLRVSRRAEHEPATVRHRYLMSRAIDPVARVKAA